MSKYFFLLCLFISTCCWADGINEDKKKASEIKLLMWASADKDFAVSTIPDKWKGEQAVIISKAITLSYRKEVMIANLSYDRYTHYRIKLLSTKAVEEYAQFRLNGSRASYPVTSDIYAGFKIIKPDGKEIEIPLSEAVKETQTLNRASRDIYKLAIPNLEVGDIVEYYIANEQTISTGQSKFYGFDPVILQLHSTYPILKQKISFDVLRRCYINLKSLNGAPPFKLAQEGNDKSHYYLEDNDRESVKDIPWLFPYRQLPAIKFKITYASALAADVLPSFIGEPGKLKSTVGSNEVKKFMEYIFQYRSPNEIGGYMKSHFKGVKDPDKLAREAYYFLRNVTRIKQAEINLLTGNEPNPESDTGTGLIALSKYYQSKNIPHEVLIGIPRQVSALNDLIFENELTLMLKVLTAKPFYIGRLDNNSMIGEIDPELQGEMVYSGNGMLPPGAWLMNKVQVPVAEAKQNSIDALYKINFTDLGEGIADMNGQRTSTGLSRVDYQNEVMDFYDYQDEEKKRFEMKENFSKSNLAKVTKLRQDYQATRQENLNKKMKEELETEFDFTIEDAHDVHLTQTGRFEDHPEFIYSFQARIKGLLRRAGPNYLLDIGKFIEKQAMVEEDERERNFDAYLPSARLYNCQVEVTLPEGYTLKGIEQLETKIENEWGGFTSTARLTGNVLVLNTSKIYKTNFVKKDNWPSLLAFLQAAYDFNKKQVVLEKK